MTRHTHDEPMPWMEAERPHHLWTSADIAAHNRRHVAPLVRRMAEPRQSERRAPLRVDWLRAVVWGVLLGCAVAFWTLLAVTLFA